MDEIFKLAVVITAVDHASSVIHNVVEKFKLLRNASEDTLRRLERFKNLSFGGMLAAGAGAAGAAATLGVMNRAVEKAGSFQEIMNNIRMQTFGKDLLTTDPAKLQQQEETMRRIADLSTRLGLATTFSDVEVGRTIEEMQKGGVELEDILSGAAEAAVKMAQLAKIPPDVAAEALVQTRAGFQLTGEQLLQAADIMTKVAAASSADIGDIMRGLGNTSGVARRAGLNVLDTSTLVALTRTTTATGEEAGTFVRNFLERLAPLTKESAKAFAAMGLLDEAGRSLLVDQKGRAKSINEIAAILRRATAGMRTDEATKYLHKMFGEQGGRVAEVILRQGTGSLEEIQANVARQLGLNEQVALQMQNFNQVVETTREAWSTFLRNLGTPLLGWLTPQFQRLGDVLQKLTEYFKTHPQVARWLFAFAGGASVLLFLGGIVITLIGALGFLNTALQAAGLTWAFVASRAMLAFGALGLLAGLAYLVYRNWDTVKRLWQEYGGIIKTVALIILAAYTPAVVAAAGQMLRLAAVTGLSILRTVALNIVTGAGALIMGAFRSIMLAVRLAQALWNATVGLSIIRTIAWYTILGIFNGVVYTVRLGILAWAAAQRVLNLAVAANPIARVIMLVVALIAVVITVTRKWGELWETLKGFAQKIPGWVNILLILFAPVIGIPLLIIKYWDKVVDKVKEVVGKIKAFLSGKSAGAAPQPVEVPAKLDTGGIARQLQDLGAGALGGVVPSLPVQAELSVKPPKSMADFKMLEYDQKPVEIPARYGLPSTAELQKQLDNAPLNLPADLDLGGLKKQIGQLPGLGSGAAAAFSTGLEKGSPRVAQGAQQLSETLKKNLPGPEQMRSLGTSIAENLAAGMTGRADQVAAAAQTLAERIISTVKSTFGIASPSAVFRDIGASMIQGLINGLKSQDINSIATKIFGGLPRALAAIFGGSSPGGDTSAWLSAALAATGAPPPWLPGLLRLVEAESGGNPRAVNPVAVGGEHATGLLQMLPSTFRAYALPGMGDIYNPVHNAAAAIRYIQARYGSIYNTPLFKRGPYKGYATGGIITHRHLAEVGEDGPEAIIPLSGHRERAVALLWQVGRILGVLRQNVAPAAGPVLSAGPSAAGILNTAPVPISSVQAAAELSPAHQATALPFGTRPAPEAQSISIPGAPAIYIHPGAITIHQAPGQDAGELVRAVFRELFPMIVREYEKMIRDRRRNTGVTPVFVR